MSPTPITKFGGKTDRITRELERGDELIIVARCVTGKLEIDELITRNVKLADVFELDGELGRTLVAALSSARISAENAAAGRAVLPGLEVTVDVAGVVETATEQAALRAGEPVTPTADDFGGTDAASIVPEPGDADPWDGALGGPIVTEHAATTKFPGPVVDLGDFVDVLAKPLAEATATELKLALERYAKTVDRQRMSDVAAALARVEEGRKSPRTRVLGYCELYLAETTAPIAPPALEVVPEPADVGESAGEEGVELDAETEAPAMRDDFPDPPDDDESDDDDGFADFTLDPDTP